MPPLYVKVYPNIQLEIVTVLDKVLFSLTTNIDFFFHHRNWK